MAPGQSLQQVYKAMGWNDSQAYLRRKHPHLQLRVAAQMAMAIGAPLGSFLEELAKEEGVPPLHERVIQKPQAHSQARRRSGACESCGSRSHTTKEHGEALAAKSVRDFEAERIAALAAAHPIAKGKP